MESLEVGQTTNINATGIAFLLILSFLILLVKRNRMIIPIIIGSCYITAAQQIVIAGFNFSVLRIIILAGWIRIMISKEYRFLKLQKLDKVIIAWVISRSIIYIIQNPYFGAVVYRLGNAYDILGIYFMFRCIIRDFNDIKRIIKIIAICILPLALFMIMEKITRINIFSVFGGVPFYSGVRYGRLRAQGSFAHPILAGTFGAASFILIAVLWLHGKKTRLLCILGLTASVIIIIASSSSGPLLSFMIGILGLLLWRYRHDLRIIRRGIVIGLIGLDIVMKPPLWAIFGKISVLVGGTGWHRTMLIDAFVRYFNEWVFIGTNYTAHWLPTVLATNPNMVDITNWYIGEAVRGGLVTMVIFIYIFITCYKIIGNIMKTAESEPLRIRGTIWIIGVTLMVHNTAILSVIYFDQVVTFFFMLLAMIGTLSTLNQNYRKHTNKDLSTSI